MEPIMPKVIIPGDREDHIMGQTGWIVGFRTYKGRPYKIIWCFGFLPDSPQAQAYGVSVTEKIWVMSDSMGNIQDTFSGLKKALPFVFQFVLNDKWHYTEDKK